MNMDGYTSYEEGQIDFHAGVPFALNPYGDESKDREEWAKGWKRARDEFWDIED